MRQTSKGKQWYFGLKAHIGVDAKTGIVHSVCATAASVADMHMLPDLLHGGERKVWGDGGYQGQTGVIREAAALAQDMTCKLGELRRIQPSRDSFRVDADLVRDLQLGLTLTAQRVHFHVSLVSRLSASLPSRFYQRQAGIRAFRSFAFRQLPSSLDLQLLDIALHRLAQVGD